MTRPEFESSIADLIRPHVPASLLGDLVKRVSAAASEYTAARIEEACRPYEWPPPVRRREQGENQQQREESA